MGGDAAASWRARFFIPRGEHAGLLLAHASICAPALPLIATIIVVAIAAVFSREPSRGMK
jgi:hypothetical protein